MNQSDTKQSEHLHKLIDRHQVVSEILPAKAVVDGELRAVGFDVLLFGTHGGGMTTMLSPGCHECVHVWKSLEEIALAVLPPTNPTTWHEIVPMENAVRYSSARGERPDIELVIALRHKSNYTEPLDACENKCLEHILTRLQELGVPEHQWRGRRGNLTRPN